MITKEIMTKDVVTCTPDSDVATAARIMLERNCGFVPVVDSRGTVTGVLTDRDICRAAVTTHRTAEHIGVRQVMSAPVFACLPDENVKTALVTMAKHHVRRLPVLDRTGHLQGVLSIDDVVRAPRRRGSPTSDDVVDTLKAICAPRTIEAVTL